MDDTVLARRGYTRIALTNDLCLMAHANNICVLCLSPDSPLCDRRVTIDEVSFQVGLGVLL